MANDFNLTLLQATEDLETIIDDDNSEDTSAAAENASKTETETMNVQRGLSILCETGITEFNNHNLDFLINRLTILGNSNQS
jgi:predicted transcriptional regulator